MEARRTGGFSPVPSSFGSGAHKLLWLPLLALYLAAAIRGFLVTKPYADELIHFAQIDMFRMGDFRLLTDYLTTIPGFHAFVAAIMKATGAGSIGFARLVSALVGLLVIAGFHALRRTLHPGTESVATLQFAVLPLLAPLFFLVYTDGMSLALVLWAAVATFRGRHGGAALLLLLSLGVRQNNVVWVGFLACMAAWPAWRDSGVAGWREMAKLVWPYCIPVVAFFAFWAWNGSISMSPLQATMHPDLSFHAGNLFCLLFVLGLLFPLHVLAGLGDFLARLRWRPGLLLLPVVAFAAFWWGFAGDHPANAIMTDWFLRNRLIVAVNDQPPVRALVGLVVALSVAGWSSLRLKPREAWWLAPFTIAFLGGSWLIEQRYVLIPLSFFLAFRCLRGRAIEWATFALWLIAAVLVVHGTLEGRFFL